MGSSSWRTARVSGSAAVFDRQPVPLSGPEDFLTFSEPNHQKLAMSWYIASGDGARDHRLVVENHTLALSEEVRRKFIPSWRLLIKQGSEIMSCILIAAIKRRAEAQARKISLTLAAG